ncbi:fungal specific transcription factor domain-containing protein [Colletotrichum musicola]|uniref:Fungal specific transcription factor domain-containing protein n=1 Tax=Colletotrichum musicola TaxID=2175873 RepID=A0A8H6MUD6_9PEZI|nr:fungal specific transcription factor domain-containing protein [Colletotrichum musicola]
METTKPKRARRRKACDLCYHKKIKCDAAQPRCSGCKLYNSDCTYTGPTRATVAKPNHVKKIEMLEARLAQLEAQGKQSHASPQLSRSSGAELSSASQTDHSSEGEQVWALRAASDSTESPSSSTYQESIPLPRSNARTLPPLRTVLPIAEEYFESSNRVLPLFDRETFMKMLRGWYTYSAYRKPDAWAAINVVLALARRDSYASSPEETQNMQRCISNVQSVLNEIVIGEPTLLALQIVLGMVLVFHGSSDPRPAAIMVATAMRLVHGLNLHTKTTAEDLEQSEELQRNRVFWIAYILDRDCAMRTRQPPIHQDSEIDVDLPSTSPADNMGIILGVSGQVFNYLRTRVQLAYIQGKVFAMIYSVRAAKLPEHERLQNTLRLREMLDDWERSIPADFLPQSAATVVPAQHLRYMALLHYTHLQLAAATHYADSHHLEWLGEALSCSKRQAPGVVAEAFAGQLPDSWGKLVDAARTCMRLYAATPENDSALTWLVACGYLTSIMFITVNNLAQPDDPCRQTDQSNVESALLLLERLIKATDDARLKKIHGACKEMNDKAKLVTPPPDSGAFFDPPGLEFGDEDPLDDGRWDLMDASFWGTNSFGTMSGNVTTF